MKTDSSTRRLTATQVRQRLGNISDMTLWRWLQNADLHFPKPMVINRRRFFLEAEIEEWEAAQAGAAA